MIEEMIEETEDEVLEEAECVDEDEGELVQGFDPDNDLDELKREFPELVATESLSDIEGAVRYGALRDLGLTPSEAYRATRKSAPRANTRAHLSPAVPRMAASPSTGISREELRVMRDVFGDISDSDIRRLYKKVTN